MNVNKSKILLLLLLFLTWIAGCNNSTIESEYYAATPRKALEHFRDGITENNVPQALAVVSGPFDNKGYIESHIKLIQAMERFAQLAESKFDMSNSPPVETIAESYSKNLENVDVVMVGDRQAKWPIDPNNPMLLVKNSEGHWQIDMDAPMYEEAIEMTISVYDDLSKVYNQVSDEIENGKIENRKQAMTRLTELRSKHNL